MRLTLSRQFFSSSSSFFSAIRNYPIIFIIRQLHSGPGHNILFGVDVEKKFQFVLIALLIAGCARPINHEADFSHDAIVRDFIRVTTKSELNQNVETGIRKWMAPLKVQIDDNAPPAMAKGIRNQLHILSQLSGLSISHATGSAKNFVVHTPLRKEVPALIKDKAFTAKNDRHIRRRIARANCFFSIQIDTRMVIRHADIVIPRDLPTAKRTHCIAEELTQALGLANDLSASQDSIFGSDSKNIALSIRDEYFIALLYHSRIETGLSVSSTKTGLRRLLEKCLPANSHGLGKNPSGEIFSRCLHTIK